MVRFQPEFFYKYIISGFNFLWEVLFRIVSAIKVYFTVDRIGRLVDCILSLIASNVSNTCMRGENEDCEAQH